MVEAVQRYERAKLNVESFRQQNERVVTHMDALREEVAVALDAAREAYLRHKDDVGPAYAGFTLIKKRSVDADLLLELVPDLIAAMKHSITMEHYDALRVQGAIEDEVAEQVEMLSESIRGPKK